MEEIQRDEDFMRILDHLVYVKALGTDENNHGIILGTDGSRLSKGLIEALVYIPALVSEVG